MEQGPLNTAASTSSKLVPIVTVGVLIAALIAGGAVYVYEHLQQVKSQQDLQSQIDGLNSQLATAKRINAIPTSTLTATPIASATARPTSSSIPDPTSDWKTYKSPQEGLSFKYPSDWTLADNSVEGSAGRINSVLLTYRHEYNAGGSIGDIPFQLGFYSGEQTSSNYACCKVFSSTSLAVPGINKKLNIFEYGISDDNKVTQIGLTDDSIQIGQKTMRPSFASKDGRSYIRFVGGFGTNGFSLPQSEFDTTYWVTTAKQILQTATY